jgi:hypothetical protein
MYKNTLVYDFEDGSIRTINGTLIATAPSLTTASMAFPMVAFNIRNLSV